MALDKRPLLRLRTGGSWKQTEQLLLLGLFLPRIVSGVHEALRFEGKKGIVPLDDGPSDEADMKILLD